MSLGKGRRVGLPGAMDLHSLPTVQGNKTLHKKLAARSEGLWKKKTRDKIPRDRGHYRPQRSGSNDMSSNPREPGNQENQSLHTNPNHSLHVKTAQIQRGDQMRVDQKETFQRRKRPCVDGKRKGGKNMLGVITTSQTRNI